MQSQLPSLPGRAVRGTISALDTLLRWRLGVFEFTSDPACILRISLARAPVSIDLPGELHIAAGEPVVDLHLWNERLPQMPRTGADLAWARRMYRAFTISFHLLAKYMALDPRLSGIRALYGEPGFLLSSELDAGAAVLRRLGFEVYRPRAQAGAWWRFAEFWQNLYSYALLWTFNPGSLRSKPFLHLERCQLWMPRQRLDERYLRPGDSL